MTKKTHCLACEQKACVLLAKRMELATPQGFFCGSRQTFHMCKHTNVCRSGVLKIVQFLTYKWRICRPPGVELHFGFCVWSPTPPPAELDLNTESAPMSNGYCVFVSSFQAGTDTKPNNTSIKWPFVLNIVHCSEKMTLLPHVEQGNFAETTFCCPAAFCT